MQESMRWRTPSPGQPLMNTVRQRQLRFPWAHPQDARWWTMQEICSLSSNSWQKETRVTKDKLHIVHPEADRGYRKWSAFRYNCLASFRLLSLEKICSHLLFSRMIIMTSNPSLDWPHTSKSRLLHQLKWYLVLCSFSREYVSLLFEVRIGSY